MRRFLKRERKTGRFIIQPGMAERRVLSNLYQTVKGQQEGVNISTRKILFAEVSWKMENKKDL